MVSRLLSCRPVRARLASRPGLLLLLGEGAGEDEDDEAANKELQPGEGPLLPSPGDEADIDLHKPQTEGHKSDGDLCIVGGDHSKSDGDLCIVGGDHSKSGDLCKIGGDHPQSGDLCNDGGDPGKEKQGSAPDKNGPFSPVLPGALLHAFDVSEEEGACDAHAAYAGSHYDESDGEDESDADEDGADPDDESDDTDSSDDDGADSPSGDDSDSADHPDDDESSGEHAADEAVESGADAADLDDEDGAAPDSVSDEGRDAHAAVASKSKDDAASYEASDVSDDDGVESVDVALVAADGEGVVDPAQQAKGDAFDENPVEFALLLTRHAAVEDEAARYLAVASTEPVDAHADAVVVAVYFTEPVDDDCASAATPYEFDAEFDEDAAPEYDVDAVQYASNAHADDVSAVGASLAEYLFSPLRGSKVVQSQEKYFTDADVDMKPKSRFKMKSELLSFYLMKGLLDPGIQGSNLILD